MADYDASVRVHAQVDTKEITEAKKEVEKLAAQLQHALELKALGGSEKQLKDLGLNIDELTDKLKTANDRLGTLKENANNVENKISLSDEVKNAKKELDSLSANGLDFGDEEFDKAYVNLKNAILLIS